MGWIIETENGSRIGWSDYADAITNQGDQPPYEQSGENAKAMAAAPDLLRILSRIIDDLPTKRDWLDPDLEKQAKEIIARLRGDAKDV
jgi:hypothetical protein